MIISTPKPDVKISRCWKCHKTNVTLFRTVPKEKGKHKKLKFERNIYYVCEQDRIYEKPI